MYELIGTVQTAKSSESPVLKEVLRVHIAEFIFRTFGILALVLDDHLPELLIRIERLCQYHLTIIIKLPPISAKQELGQVLQYILMPFGKSFVGMEAPQFGQLMVGVCRNLEHLHELTGTTLVITGKVEVFGQFVLASSEGVGQQVIQPLVTGFILSDMANEHLDVDVAVLQGAHIFLEILGRIEKASGTFLYLVIDLDVGTDIIPIGIEYESYLLHLAGCDNPDKVLR